MFDSLIIGAGLQGLADNLISGWIGPVFILAVAAFSVMFIKDRAWMKLLGFVGIAAIVGVLVFFGDSYFGQKGKLSGVAKGQADQISNDIYVSYQMIADTARGFLIR